MKYQNIINLLDNTPNQPSKFKTKNWVKINNDSRVTYNNNSQINFKTSMLKSSLGDYITVPNTEVAAADANNDDKKSDIKKLCSFYWLHYRIKNRQVDNAKDIDVIMPIYSLTEYCDNYLKTSGSL